VPSGVQVATRKKTGIDSWIWVDYVSRLQELAATPAAATFFYNGLVYISPVKLINVDVFCAGAQTIYVEPVLSDFQSGAWIQMYKNAVDHANYYAWCEEY